MRRWQRDKEWQIFQELAEFSNRNEGRARGWRPEDDRSHENSTSNEMLIDTEFQSSPFGVFPFLCSPRFRFIVRRPLFSFHPPKSTLLLFTATRISLQPVRNWFARTTRSKFRSCGFLDLFLMTCRKSLTNTFYVKYLIKTLGTKYCKQNVF